MTHIDLYDTTLRDGTQREGISLSLDDKLKIAARLDAFGMDYIEGGWPGSNPKDVEFFQRAPALGLSHAKLAAFGSTRRKGVRPADDGNIQALIGARTPVVTLVGKSWELHVVEILETTVAENLAMIEESVAYCKAQGKEVIYDAEHFFDGYRASSAHAVATLEAAARGGADFIVLCDTNGGSLPWEIADAVAAVKGRLGDAGLGIHTHDDGGCAVANTLAAVRAGAVQVQGTVNGYGERVANANLCTIIPDLQLKMGYRCVSVDQLARLTDLSRYVAELANLTHDDHLPYVGTSAFAHKGGIHVAAMLKHADSYQHIDPTAVGNRRRSVVSELSGRGNLVDKIEQYNLNPESLDIAKVLDQIKQLEAQGFTFEGAEASVELMLRRTHPAYVPPFEMTDYWVMVQKRRGGRGTIVEATVKVRVGPQIMHTVAEGNGPVNALDTALRQALTGIFPQISSVRLEDYKVRILDGENNTAATTRVLIETRQGTRRWSTVGASPNIIDASWRALADSMEYALIH
ncbi:MAG: citramalate synthase [Candidatus Promineofilum sp.]|uniref:citramalate synthase n=1 Tax=Promineifilum sp. TaxID=2664178 RepID=UPI002411D951|nr:citramalate synthase [Promineifilum sp.]